MSLPGATFYPAGEGGPEEGDKVLTIPADSWVRRPDVEFDVFQAAFVSIDGKSDVLYLLDLIRELVALAIDAAAALLEGRPAKVGARKRVEVDHLPRPESTPGATWEKVEIPDEIGPLKSWKDEEAPSSEKG